MHSDGTQSGAPHQRIFDCVVDLAEWKLHIAHLIRRQGRDLGNVMDTATAGALAHLRRCVPEGNLEQSQAIVALRDSLKRLGLDPEVTPPSSERLIAQLLESEAAARGPLAWEFFTILVAKTQAPWSVLDRNQLNPPLIFRLGESGERIQGMDTALDCAGLPVLADQDGVLASPWTCVPPSALDECAEPVFVCYVPKELFRTVEPRAHVGRAVWLTWAYKFVFERTCSCRAGAG